MSIAPHDDRTRQTTDLAGFDPFYVGAVGFVCGCIAFYVIAQNTIGHLPAPKYTGDPTDVDLIDLNENLHGLKQTALCGFLALAGGVAGAILGLSIRTNGLRFRLRTLLIAITLVAAFLGLRAWARSAQEVVSVGMSEAEVRKLYDPISIDRGVFYWGDSGLRRMYWQLDLQTQTWVDFDANSRVVNTGPREPKLLWIRNGGDSITVDWMKNTYRQ